MKKIKYHVKKNRGRFVLHIALTLLFVFSLIVFTNPALKSKITGMVLATVYVQSATYLWCNFTLEPGWNLVSVPCFNNSNSVSGHFVASSVNRMFAYDESRPEDPWRSYNPNLGSQYAQDLSSISRLEGYYIYANARTNYSFSNFLSPPYLLDLEVGWNLVGYPNITTNDINASTSSVFGSYTIIRAMNNTNKTYMYYIYNDANSTLNYTYPYHGYWFNMSSADTWVVY